MTETGFSAFLAQAHENNWRMYLASLQEGSQRGWDICILTAADERQAGMYRCQLERRRAVGLLPASTDFLVIPDPGGRRIGSGGATLRALLALCDRHRQAENQRLLIIHSGGDSRRLPHCSATGKLFARVPRPLPDGRASTLFDEFLISLSGLARELPPGVLVASGDVVLIFDHLQLSLQRSGVTGVAAAAPVAMAAHHGVYVSDSGQRVRAYLHKLPPEELHRMGAVAPDGSAQVDTGLVWLDSAMAQKLVAIAQESAVASLLNPITHEEVAEAGRLNLYADLLLPLAQSTTFEAYLGDTSDGPATPALVQARHVLWRYLRDTAFWVERLQPAVFVHFGTSQEYWRLLAAEPVIARTCGWRHHIASRLSEAARCHGERLVLINSSLDTKPLPDIPSDEAVSPGLQTAVIVDSVLSGPLSWQGACLLANVCTTEPIPLVGDIVLHQLPTDLGFVTRIVGLHDDPKKGCRQPGATFLNRPWDDWLAEAHLSAQDLWPNLPAAEHTLWNASLYPVTADREESLRLSLPLQQPGNAPLSWRERWLASTRLSLADGFLRADGDCLLAELAAVEDHVAARRFLDAIVQEQPASQAKEIISPLRGGERPGVRSFPAQRLVLVDTWLAASPAIVRLRGYKALAEATSDATWETRAFELLAAMIRAGQASSSEVEAWHRHASTEPMAECRSTPRPPTVTVGVGRWLATEPALSIAKGLTAPISIEGLSGVRAVRVQAAARIDFGGGWTDTPPYSIERGGTVLNAAITLRGVYPIVADGAWLDQPRLVLDSRDIETTLEPQVVGEVLAYNDPADPFALHKAALVLCGIVPADCDPALPVTDLLRPLGYGLRLSTQTSIPRGSGLGTSSIMAGAVLSCLARMQGLERTQAQLFNDVLCLEQMLTTGGGWQDQVGGLCGGIKLATTAPGLPQQIQVEPVALSPQTEAELSRRLLLVYTGQQRLAKNLLRAIMGRWMARDPEMTWILAEIARLAVAMRAALAGSDLDGFGRLLSEHWVLNKRMDPGCTNPFIDDLFAFMAPYINGGKLAGAGGGGFAIAIARSGEAAQDLAAALQKRYRGTGVAIWPVAVPAAGLNIQG
ncbi:MAG: fucose pyrophosphorylase domain-containing protein [Anaerolineae bacterium]